MGYRNEFLSMYGHDDHLHEVIDNKEAGDLYSNLSYVVKNPSLDHSHMTKILKVATSTQVKGLIAEHPKIKDSHVEQIMSDQSYNVAHAKQKVMANPKVSTSAIKKAFDDGDRETQALIGKHNKLPKELRQHVLNNTYDPDVKRIIHSRIKHDNDLDSMMDSIDLNELK
jgi:hypothetical protein